MKNKRGVTIKGVESVGDKFRVFVERHQPCRVSEAELHSNITAVHEGCTVVQRHVSNEYATIAEAISAAERVHVEFSDGTSPNWKSVGS